MGLCNREHFLRHGIEADAVAVIKLAATFGTSTGKHQKNITASRQHELGPGFQRQFGVENGDLSWQLEGDILLSDEDVMACGAEYQVAGKIVLVGEIIGDSRPEAGTGEHRNARSRARWQRWQRDLLEAARRYFCNAAAILKCAYGIEGIVVIADVVPQFIGVVMRVDRGTTFDLH